MASSLVSYYGGKSTQSNFIYSQITPEMKSSISTYVEPFSGLFWVYFNEDFSWCKNIIYNDMNQFLTNFLVCAKDKKLSEYFDYLNQPGKLFHFNPYIDSDPATSYKINYDYFKSLFEHFRKEIYTDNIGKEIRIDIPDYQLAIKYGFLLRHAFSGISHEKIGFSYSASSYKEGKKVPEPKSQILIRKLKDEKLINKLNGITHFGTYDFQDLIEVHDNENTLFYVDPPYFSCENNYYRGNENFGKKGHERLANVLKNIKGKFILSYYDFDNLKVMYPEDKYRWERKSFTKATTSITKDKNHNKQGHEILIMNY